MLIMHMQENEKPHFPTALPVLFLSIYSREIPTSEIDKFNPILFCDFISTLL